MVEKYIIDKADMHDLLTGKEIPLEQGSKARAFCIEIADGMTNGEVMQALFPKLELGELVYNRRRYFLMGEAIDTFDFKTTDKWWSAPYKAEKGGEE